MTGRNILTELKELVGTETAKNKIVEVISYESLTGVVTYKSGGSANISTFVSDVPYSPGDSLVLDGDNVIGLAEPISNTAWIG